MIVLSYNAIAEPIIEARQIVNCVACSCSSCKRDRQLLMWRQNHRALLYQAVTLRNLYPQDGWERSLEASLMGPSSFDQQSPYTCELSIPASTWGFRLCPWHHLCPHHRMPQTVGDSKTGAFLYILLDNKQSDPCAMVLELTWWNQFHSNCSLFWIRTLPAPSTARISCY